MKRAFLSLVFTCLLLSASATDYKFLTFENTDGSKVSLSATGLTLTFSDGNLVASDGTIIPLGNLAKMYFTETSGITTATSTASGTIKVFTLSGILVDTYTDGQIPVSLPKGIYIIKDHQGNTHKTTIR